MGGWPGGWPGGWLEKVELRLSQLSTKIEVEVDLKLSLAILEDDQLEHL